MVYLKKWEILFLETTQAFLTKKKKRIWKYITKIKKLEFTDTTDRDYVK